MRKDKFPVICGRESNLNLFAIPTRESAADFPGKPLGIMSVKRYRSARDLDSPAVVAAAFGTAMLAQVQRSPELVGVWRKQRGKWLRLFGGGAENRGVMIPVLDPDPESDFQLSGDSGFGIVKNPNPNTYTEDIG